MKKVCIVGMGMSAGSLTQEALAALRDAEVRIGAKRMLQMLPPGEKPVIEAFSPGDVRAAVEGQDAERFAVLVSGDVGFYSAAEGLCEALRAHALRLLPGISSLNYLFARLRRPWQDAALISCHGREANLVDTVRRNKQSFALCGANAAALLGRLADAGFGGLSATIGENLGTAQERIRTMPVSAWSGVELSALCVLLIENPDFDDSVPTGIPDASFLRGSVPMTKAEPRAVIMSRLALRPGDICFDIGCGTGSVTVEMALSTYKGHVYAMDKNADAVALTKANCAAFHIGNVTAFSGGAPGALRELPPPDAVFIGGSGGCMEEIVDCVAAKNPKARIVAAAISIEGAHAALTALARAGLPARAVQIAAARAEAAGALHMLRALNPIFVIEGGGHG